MLATSDLESSTSSAASWWSSTSPNTKTGLRQRQHLYFKLPRVVPDQHQRFLSDELFKRNAVDMQVRYTQFRDLPLSERRAKFLAGCRHGHIEVAHMNTGLVLVLKWNPSGTPTTNLAGCEFDTRDNKMWLSCPLILNGVCVAWRGWLDVQSLEGMAAIHFDSEAAKMEDERLRRQLHLNLANMNTEEQQEHQHYVNHRLP